MAVIKRDREQGVENECVWLGGAQYTQEPHRLCCCRLSGRFKSHANNIVFDVFIPTCQDSAQNMESSQID
ncbi:hypothetical protein Bca52824_053415 [Brassica carinata]|uniref:Uncharacterized protein n=1 Tax=Brassica carinata TaxID=52824 RepID=A0A8X7UJL2_BRACI|nr:hypothetical protein Bca52824_053415 [Brassica carinata]